MSLGLHSKAAVRLRHLCGLIDILTERVSRLTAGVQGVILQHRIYEQPENWTVKRGQYFMVLDQ